MDIDYDPAKDTANIAKHGISLAAAEAMELEFVRLGRRTEYGEDRLRGFGTIAGKTYCLVFTVRDGRVRAISLRRSRDKEYRHAL